MIKWLPGSLINVIFLKKKYLHTVPLCLCDELLVIAKNNGDRIKYIFQKHAHLTPLEFLSVFRVMKARQEIISLP